MTAPRRASSQRDNPAPINTLCLCGAGAMAPWGHALANRWLGGSGYEIVFDYLALWISAPRTLEFAWGAVGLDDYGVEIV